MAISYKIHFQPGRYFVQPAQTGAIPYFHIVDDETRQPVAVAFSENMALTLCLSLDLISAMIKGDRQRGRELTKLIDDLKNKQDG